jgi:uncharacterized protein (TIGR02611 family)
MAIVKTASNNRAATFGELCRMPRIETMLIHTLKQAKRFLKILFGFTLLTLGLVMVFTPGPGWLVIVLGLGVLAAEYVWAQRLLERLKEQGLRLHHTLHLPLRTRRA